MSSLILAIDPGDVDSAYVQVEPGTFRPVRFGKVPNRELLALCDEYQGPAYIEMIASYGMPVGAEVFDTCVWIGRFAQAHLHATSELPTLVFRKPIKKHLCGTIHAKDPNVIQALRDRFAPGASNYGKGTKAAPGWFYGFSKDVWQAYALAVYALDELHVVPF